MDTGKLYSVRTVWLLGWIDHRVKLRGGCTTLSPPLFAKKVYKHKTLISSLMRVFLKEGFYIKIPTILADKTDASVAPMSNFIPKPDTMPAFSLSIPLTLPATIPIDEKLAKLVRNTDT